MHLLDVGYRQVQQVRVGQWVQVEGSDWEEVLEIDWVHATAHIVLGPRERVIMRNAWYTLRVAREVMD